MSRRQLLEVAGTAAAAIAVAGLGAKAAPAATSPAPVPFKATSTHLIQEVAAFVLPVDPPQLVETFAIKAKTTPLGDVTFSEHHVARLDENGVPRSLTDGTGVFTAANGDAIFLSHHAILHPTATGITGEGVFTITGGRGAYCGAVGSGKATAIIDGAKGEVTFNWEGMIQLPAKA